jgi:hypothetical protein
LLFGLVQYHLRQWESGSILFGEADLLPSITLVLGPLSFYTSSWLSCLDPKVLLLGSWIIIFKVDFDVVGLRVVFPLLSLGHVFGTLQLVDLLTFVRCLGLWDRMLIRIRRHCDVVFAISLIRALEVIQ